MSTNALRTLVCMCILLACWCLSMSLVLVLNLNPMVWIIWLTAFLGGAAYQHASRDK